MGEPGVLDAGRTGERPSATSTNQTKSSSGEAGGDEGRAEPSKEKKAGVDVEAGARGDPPTLRRRGASG